MRFSTLDFDLKDHVATITLNRPEAANAMNLDLGKELLQVALECDSPHVRAVIITGAGKVFSVGGDLKDFAEKSSNLSSHVKELTVYLNAVITRFTRMNAPVIAAVNGVAAGGGMNLAIACDIVIAAESARFSTSYTKVGLTPDISGSYFLPRIVGLKRALELNVTNRVLSAQEAYEWGIVTKVVPNDEVLLEASAIAEQFAMGPTAAFGEVKRLLHHGWNQTLETQMENESQTIAKIAETKQALEGITAFLEKRKPNF